MRRIWRIVPGALAALAPLGVRAQDATAPAAQDAGVADVAAPAGEAAHHVVIPFFSLFNTNFVVLISFLIFVAVLVYMRVPHQLSALLDGRAKAIRDDLDEARKLREDAQALLASYERKQKDVQAQADRIVETARADATAAAEKARKDLEVAIARRLAAADGQIAAAEAAAVREVRNRAAEIAAQVAGEILARGLEPARANALIDDVIDEVGTRLN